MAEEMEPIENTIAENEEIKVEELDDKDLEDASGGASNTGCNCGCGVDPS